jgi:transcription termination factor NusB
LAKVFGAEQSFKFVNGVLDAVARDVRDSEQ